MFGLVSCFATRMPKLVARAQGLTALEERVQSWPAQVKRLRRVWRKQTWTPRTELPMPSRLWRVPPRMPPKRLVHHWRMESYWGDLLVLKELWWRLR